MTIAKLSSSLEDFSLAELFRMLEQGKKNGCLTLFGLPVKTAEMKSCYHIWFRQGRIVAAADQLHGQGLMTQMIARGWLDKPSVDRLYSYAAPETPLGLALKTQGALQADQLNLLFKVQLQRVWLLFELQTGRFSMDSKAPLPSLEMTGLSISAMEAALVGLRNLKNWEALKHALPDAYSGIRSTFKGQPTLHLNPLEWQLWEFANGTVSLEGIAQEILQPFAKVQQAAYRLMMAGLVEEVPVMNQAELAPSLTQNISITELLPPTSVQAEVKVPVSQNLLQNLVGFLRGKS
uniref:PatA-like N-terminal domain-containing protein n=1 Tax=Cyanothece sp. (strain PCC 7425 / ATCC 29141) TaxID=395961 RepID=B8HR35_CYAP4